MKTDYFIDSHCHLDWKSFSGEQATIIARAKNVSVGGMLSINTHPKHFPALHDLVRSYKTVWCSVGVHPCYIKEQDDDDNTLMSVLSDYARYDKTVAIGETGLDYKEAQADADKQKRFLLFIYESPAPAISLLSSIYEKQKMILSRLWSRFGRIILNYELFFIVLTAVRCLLGSLCNGVFISLFQDW